MANTENFLTEVTAYSKPNSKWFRNSEMDLTVDFAEDESIKSFQIDYIEKFKAYSLTWIDFKLKNYVIDEGEATPMKNQAPLIVGERKDQSPYLAETFARVSQKLPSDIRDFVLEKLNSARTQLSILS